MGGPKKKPKSTHVCFLNLSFSLYRNINYNCNVIVFLALCFTLLGKTEKVLHTEKQKPIFFKIGIISESTALESGISFLAEMAEDK